MRTLGLSTNLPLLGFVFSEQWAKTNPAAIDSFLRAAHAAEQRLATSDADWQRLRPLRRARNDAELAHIRDAFRAGIPQGWGSREQSEAAKLVPQLAQTLNDPQVTGLSKTIAPGTFFATAHRHQLPR